MSVPAMAGRPTAAAIATPIKGIRAHQCDRPRPSFWTTGAGYETNGVLAASALAIS